MTDESGIDCFAEPAVAEAVAASNAEVAAILAEDLGAFADSLASDVIVNSPRGTINRRDDTLAAFAGGFIRYSSFDRRIEYAGKLCELVVIMGNEILAPKDRAPMSEGLCIEDSRIFGGTNRESGVSRSARRRSRRLNECSRLAAIVMSTWTILSTPRSSLYISERSDNPRES